MSIYFRRIVTIIINEYLSQYLKKDVKNVAIDDTEKCLHSIRKPPLELQWGIHIIQL